MTPNRRLIAQYSDVYRPIIDIRASFARMYNRGTRVHAHKCLRVCVYVESTTERYAQFKTANTGAFDAH